MACEGHFCSNYLLLKPEEATCEDLVRLLLSSDLESRKFIECPKGVRWSGFQSRWMLFISVVVQKALLKGEKPMDLMGKGLEKWLNLLSSNEGLFNLLLNYSRGKEVNPPERDSEKFRSVLGNLDVRVELDKRIKRDKDMEQYTAFLSMMAAKLSYENEAFTEAVVTKLWNMKFEKFYSNWNYFLGSASTKAIMIQDTTADPNIIVVAFRGTEPFDAVAWRTDFDFSFYELHNVGKIHSGFLKALGLQKDGSLPEEIDQQSNTDHHEFAYYAIRQNLKEILKGNGRAKFILTGHSLGGALAILFVAVLAMHDEKWLLQRLDGVYTFGQPRVGDSKFGRFMEEKLTFYDVRYVRYVYCNDMVPRIPYDDKTLLFKHFGRCHYYNSLYQGKVVLEEPNKNYFSLLWFIPKILNAVWEILRSFIIPYVRGPDYKESGFMTVLRLIGLVIPGLAAHAPQDYVNTTRLGSLHTTQELQTRRQNLEMDSKFD